MYYNRLVIHKILKSDGCGLELPGKCVSKYWELRLRMGVSYWPEGVHRRKESRVFNLEDLLI